MYVKKMLRIPGGLPGDGEILKLSPMVSADQIVTKGCRQASRRRRQVVHQVDSFLHGSHFKQKLDFHIYLLV